MHACLTLCLSSNVIEVCCNFISKVIYNYFLKFLKLFNHNRVCVTRYQHEIFDQCAIELADPKMIP